jgi:hypothetical protein
MAHPLLNAGYDRNTFSAGLIDLIASFGTCSWRSSESPLA